MRNNPTIFIIVFSIIILLIDFYSYRGVKKLITGYNRKTKRIIRLLFWIVPILLINGLVLYITLYSFIPASNLLMYFHFISSTFILFYLPKLVFIIFNLFDDLLLIFKKILNRLNVNNKKSVNKGKPISRAQFLNRIGIVIAGVPFLSIAYGIKWGRFNFTVREHSLTFDNLPASFDGMRIVQFSDFHLGSFLNNKDKVEEAIEIINQQNADLLLFTGDLVNNVASELSEFATMFDKLKAKIGKYSILGNHDYGDYVRWKSAEEKKQNFKNLIDLQESVGFKMLLNDSQKIDINGEKIELIGVENWGLKPFPQYGDLNKALLKTNPDSFKILLSHDPTHWDEQVLNHTKIDLTLSGHTHGAQFGIEIPGWRWSPVNIRYKRWGGIYQEGNQYLHVNTGIGFIGFPGRVGMPPEITVIELKKSV